MTHKEQIKELAELIHLDYPEVNSQHIATLAVDWFDKKTTSDVRTKMFFSDPSVILKKPDSCT